MIALGILCVLGIVFAGEIVHGIAGGVWKIDGKGELTVTLTRVMLPFILLVALGA